MFEIRTWNFYVIWKTKWHRYYFVSWRTMWNEFLKNFSGIKIVACYCLSFDQRRIFILFNTGVGRSFNTLLKGLIGRYFKYTGFWAKAVKLQWKTNLSRFYLSKEVDFNNLLKLCLTHEINLSKNYDEKVRWVAGNP